MTHEKSELRQLAPTVLLQALDAIAMAKNMERTALILRVNRNTHTPTTQADRDRNAAIGGREPVNAKDQ